MADVGDAINVDDELPRALTMMPNLVNLVDDLSVRKAAGKKKLSAAWNHFVKIPSTEGQVVACRHCAYR